MSYITSLQQEFVSRLEELCLFHTELSDSGDELSQAKADQVLTLIQAAFNLAVVIDACEDESGDVAETVKKWLYCATSTLLFNNKKIALTQEQKVEETELE